MKNPVEKPVAARWFGRIGVIPAGACALLMLSLGTGCPNMDSLSAVDTQSADEASQDDTAEKGDNIEVASRGIVVVQADQAASDAGPFVSGRILVKFRDNVADTKKKDILAEEDANESGSIPQVGIKIIDLPAQASEIAKVH